MTNLRFVFTFCAVMLTANSYAVTLEQKIGQMIMVAFSGDNPQHFQVKELKRDLENGLLGGIMVGGSNVQNPKQLTTLMKSLQQSAKKGAMPVLFTVDQEGGAVQRLSAQKGFDKYERPRKYFQNGNIDHAKKQWKKMACEIKNYGFNVNLAPVVDLDIVPNSPAIGRWGRAFSKDPKQTTRWAEAFIDAHHACGALTVLKHFPGHGSALDDTHEGFVDVTNHWSKKELIPYKNLMQKGKVDIIMTAHVVNRNFSNMPATLSPEILGGLLRRDMGYRGVIITDDLMMGAIDKYYSFEERLIAAVNAGADILLIAAMKDPDADNARRARVAILNAVQKGKISQDRIEQSYKRIKKLH